MVVKGKLTREEVVIISKGLLSPKNFKSDIEDSLKNLNMRNVDIYLIHDHEKFFVNFDSSSAKKTTENIIKHLEDNAEKSKIKYYGISIGDYYLMENKFLYPNLEEIYSIAEKVAGSKNHFKVVELPLNIVRPEALIQKDQKIKEKKLSLIEAAHDLNLNVISTETLCRGSVSAHPLLNKIDGATLFQKEIQLMRSLPNITTALFGSKNPAHVKENMKVRELPCINHKRALDTFLNVTSDLKKEWWIKKASR
ncbi:MAG: aldo/keto reductase [Candidatus Methanofastidiosia archaeon]